MSVINLTASAFEQEVMKSDKPVLIDFYAHWCGPCRMVSPFVSEIAEEYDQYKVCKVNVDEEPELAGAFGVSNIPMLVVVKGGKITASHTGAIPKESILQLIES
ncbi:MAG: thioredoxin [Oscillospiraceae bacterium]|nr:thioredoxin [Oscillospiraceae bacterium]